MDTSKKEDDKDKEQLEQQDDFCDEPPLLLSPPDGGWGWLIVFASFMCNVIVDGIIFSFGVFLVELANSFNETKGRTAWVGSLLAGFYLIAGPLVSALANTYGCRPVTIFGSFLASIGFILSVFATDISYLCVTFGVLGGIGFGFIYLPAIVTVGFYFTQRRAFATGIAVCGSGVGAFIMAPLTTVLVENYTWRGAMLIFAAIVLHCAVFGSLFRPLEQERPAPSENLKPLLLRIKEARDALRKWDSEEYIGGSLLHENKCRSLPGIQTVPEDGPRPSLETTHISMVLQKEQHLYDIGSGRMSSSDDHTNCTSSPTGSNNSPPPPYSEVVGDEMFSFLKHSGSKGKNSNSLTEQKETSSSRWHDRLSFLSWRKQSNHSRKCDKKTYYLRPFYRQDILYSASLIRLPEFRSQPDLEHYHMSVTKLPETDDPGDNSGPCGCSSAMTDTFRQTLDFSLLRSPTFLLLGLAGFMTLAGFFVPFMYIIDFAMLMDIKVEEATFILSVIGITNTVGRVFCGWLSDRPQVNALIINNVALIIGGLSTFFVPCLDSYPLLLTYGAVFGFSIACFAALRSIIVVELLGLEKLTNAFGLLLLFQGVASIIGAPVAGLFFDSTGSYDASFYIAGSVITLSGIMCCLLPVVSRFENRRKAAEEVDLTECPTDV